ncbi:MAG: glycoside hydrolase family 5 protein [Clostridiales bacterium]|nr:glycoside hydrolase family 5 protein [Clostridiales bacterium]
MLKKMGIYRGVNLGGWLSQCDYSDERLNEFIREEDFARIASWKLDHVRIPVDYNVLDDGRGYQKLDWAVEMCRKYGLKMVLDLHKTAGFSFDKGEAETGFFDSESYQERFYALWEDIARRYGHMTDLLVFELLNEVTEPRFIDVWNRVANETIRRIRAITPEMIVLVGSYWNNSASSVKDLDAPYDDKVLYNFHCYEPLAFTHQGAPWVENFDVNARVPFEESGATEEYFENLFASAIEKAKSHNTVLYCGEYGVIDVVNAGDNVKWMKTINAVLEKHGIARALWSYKAMDFGLTDQRLDAVRDELLKYL